MKIIGLRTRGYILDAEESEVARLIGYYWLGESGCPPLTVGMELRVSELYEQLYYLARNQQALSEAERLLQKVANTIRLIAPVVVSPPPAGESEVVADEVRTTSE